MRAAPQSPAVDPGSFRDRDGRVFCAGARVLRALSAGAAQDWQALRRSRLFAAHTAAGSLIGTREPDDAQALLQQLPAPAGGAWSAVVEHDVVPFVSYPYEWCFGMLRAAALQQLELLIAALPEDLTLIDGSPYNTQWRGVAPVFIDLPSLRAYRAGGAWSGYRQFCQLLLYPLMLQAYRGVDFHAWLRGSLDGIAPAQLRRLLSWRDLWRPGVLGHVVLHSRLQAQHAGTTRDVRSELSAAGFHKELVLGNARRLHRLVTGLRWRSAVSEWSEYTHTRSYEADDLQRKLAFVQGAAAARRWELVWDIGCNTGEVARLVAEHAETVVALDKDHLAIERLYQGLAASGPRNVLPLVFDVADPSPGLGWLGRERRPAAERGRPDLALALAFVHHAVLGANIPLDELVAWLAELTRSTLVVEFVDKADPMAQRLLRAKEDRFADYERGRFEQLLGQHFVVRQRLELRCKTRVLYLADKP